MEDKLLRTNLTSGSVATLTDKCITNFERLLDFGIDTELLENALADFTLWADGVGALAQPGASLDSRLKERPDDMSLVKSILAMLFSFLDELAQISLRENSINGRGRLVRNDMLWSIESSLKNLSLIGVAIRRTGKASRIRRAEKKFNPAEHEDFRKHLECIVLLRPSRDGPDSHDMSPSKLNEVQNRLIEANLRRRHSFLTAQKHTPSLKNRFGRNQVGPEGFAVTTNPEVPLRPVDRSISNLGALPREQSKPPPAAPRTTALQSTASTAEGLLQYAPATSTAEVAKTQITAIAADAELPRQPRLSPGRLIFECPCCCQSIPVTENWK